MQAMIFAAGLGTRFKPWTDKHPKALALVNGKSLLQRNIEYLQKYAITEVVVNVHHFADQLIEAIEKNKGWGSRITVSDERNVVLETGGGLKKASPYLHSENIVIINADILTDMDLKVMLNYHQREQPLATLAVTDRSTSRYFLFDTNNIMCGWRNSKTGEEKISRKTNQFVPKAFSGIHIISNKLLPLLTQEGKFGIVDVYLELSKTHIIKSFDHSGSHFVDVGKPESVAIAEKLFK
jgi:NDP-sugar pyrophosphorylase family protein